MMKTIENSETCKVWIQQEGNSVWDKYEVTHKELCMHNGAERLGFLRYGFKHIDCKIPQILTIQAETESEKKKPDQFNLDNCDHSEKCTKTQAKTNLLSRDTVVESQKIDSNTELEGYPDCLRQKISSVNHTGTVNLSTKVKAGLEQRLMQANSPSL